ncbi:cohesin domain-containing protein [Halovivax limisalsi]|uniref:cohesin domain-containing protein n=1 Tax=Halovivax limisalsi TaxID=1453760 RepID=UPI001FFCDB8F|nr:cohesin domain-containing protein [Halovivax limisalsi]
MTRLLAVSLALLLVGATFAPIAGAVSGTATSTDVGASATAVSGADDIDASIAKHGSESTNEVASTAAVTVGVVGDGAYAADVAGMIEDASGGEISAEVVSGDEAAGAGYSVYVVQHIDDAAVEDFVEATSSADVGVVYLDQWNEASQDANGVEQFASVSDAVDRVEGDYDPNESADGPNYVVTDSHPIVEDYAVGESIPIHTEPFADHAWINGTTFDAIADVSVDGETKGVGLAVDDSSATVLAASSGLNQYANATAHTDAAASLLASAVAHVNPTPDEGFIRAGDATAAEGQTATVSLDTDLENIAGYQARLNYDPSVVSFVEASGVDIADPTVNDDEGTLTLSASQTNGVDAPTLADLTFEVVGSTGEATDLTFDADFTQLNTEDAIVQPAEYVAGSIAVETDTPPEGFIRLGEAEASAGQTATVSLDTDRENIAGYQARIDYDPSVVAFVEAAGVDINDPTVNAENGTLTLSASQAQGVDAPTLANLTFEAVGSAGDATDLTFDTEFTRLNTEDAIVQPAEYLDGSVTVGESACELPGDVDGDGQVTSIDATKTQQHIVGMDPGNFNEACADLNGDGEITPADVTQIQQIIVGIES